MKYHIQGKGVVNLSDKDFLASGGEGSVYVQGGTAFKIYSDPKKMIPLGKIQELSHLTNDDIIKPKDIITDSSGNKPVGYTMKYVDDTYSLCQLFNKSFRDRNKFTPDMALDLVRKLQEIIKHTHDKNILIVDLNELNFLSSHDFKKVYAIDVDSWQTPSYHASALMESVRDRHSKTFSQLTDWFAFAIVSFQLMIGIHPYKGKHSQLKNIDERMIKNISVLNTEVSVPQVCYPFSVIPAVYMDWYKAVFERGERLAPPNDLHAVITLVQTTKKICGSNNFEIHEYGSYDSHILDIVLINNSKVILTQKNIFFEKDKVNVTTNCKMSVTPKYNNIITANIENKKLTFFNVTSRENIDYPVNVDGIMEYDNRFYIKSGVHISEISYSNESINGKNLIISAVVVANILEKSTKMYDGVAIQNILGATYVSMFPQSKHHLQVKIPELNDYKIIDAKYDGGILMVNGCNKNGTYDKIIFRFNDSDYDMRVIKDINPSGLNFITLDNGICIHLNDEESIEIFSKKKDAQGINIIDDPEISGNMNLFKMGAKVLISKSDKLYSLTMKKKA
jgi:serine/threonine protein kinase